MPLINPPSGDAPQTASGPVTGPPPAGAISPETSRLRSRIGWGVPLLGMPVTLALSAVLAAQVSRFAAIGLRLAPDNMTFRLGRTLVIFAALAAYVAVISWLIVKGIPALAGYHGS